VKRAWHSLPRSGESPLKTAHVSLAHTSQRPLQLTVLESNCRHGHSLETDSSGVTVEKRKKEDQRRYSTHVSNTPSRVKRVARYHEFGMPRQPQLSER
jgi:hypothetical protein